jgi:SAM-dependent methyltransferase
MSIFNNLYANQYDFFYENKDYKGECDLIDQLLIRFSNIKNKLLLDVGCGTGTHAIELSQRGYIVTGVDLSQKMIDLAIAKSHKYKLIHNPLWICDDIKSFNTGSLYDVVIMMFAVVGYLKNNDDLIAGLKNIRKHLKPGSIFICDFWYGPSVLTDPPTDRVLEIKTSAGKIIRSSSTILNFLNQTADVHFNISTIELGKLIHESKEMHSMRYFFPKEFELFLSIAGFKLLNISEFPFLDKILSNQSRSALAISVAI